jgi:hypothetical protein
MIFQKSIRKGHCRGGQPPVRFQHLQCLLILICLYPYQQMIVGTIGVVKENHDRRNGIPEGTEMKILHHGRDLVTTSVHVQGLPDDLRLPAGGPAQLPDRFLVEHQLGMLFGQGQCEVFTQDNP